MDKNCTMNRLDLFGNFSRNVTENDENITFLTDYILWQYNEKLFEANKLVLGYLIIVIILGVFGNGAVVYIYRCRFKRNTLNFFILYLGIFDVITAVLLSFETVDRRYPMYSGHIPVLCKTVRLVECLCLTWSAGILVCIAFDRYYHICHPMKTFTMGKAKKLLAAVMCVGCMLAWPIALFHGAETVPTGIAGVSGTDCADDEAFEGTPIVPIFYACYMVMNIICFVILFVLYTLLFKEIWKWKHKMVGEDVNKMKSLRTVSQIVAGTVEVPLSKTDVILNCGSGHYRKEDVDSRNNSLASSKCPVNYSKDHIHTSESSRQNKNNSNTQEHTHVDSVEDSGHINRIFSFPEDDKASPYVISVRKSVGRSVSQDSDRERGSILSRLSSLSSVLKKKFSRGSVDRNRSAKSAASLTQSTFLFSIITAAFILSFIPYFMIEVLHTQGVLDLNGDISLVNKQLLRLANSSLCLNQAINPILYSIFNPNFRKELRIIFFGKKSLPKR